MSKLGKWNYYFFQWFFIRLGRVVVECECGKETKAGYTLLLGVVPLTGWGTPFKYLWRKKNVNY